MPPQCHPAAGSVRLPSQDDAGWGALSRLPGHPMMWLLILSELAVFGAAFAMFAIARLLDPGGFDAAQGHLDRVLGGVNTMVLLTSGWLAALAVRAKQDGYDRRSLQMMIAAIIVGTAFIVIKVIEYMAKAEAGIGIETNTFFTLYYLMTGFHFLHVLLGLAILGVVIWKNSLENLETGAAFWHMVDIVWIVMYPLIYLVH